MSIMLPPTTVMIINHSPGGAAASHSPPGHPAADTPPLCEPLFGRSPSALNAACDPATELLSAATRCPALISGCVSEVGTHTKLFDTAAADAAAAAGSRV